MLVLLEVVVVVLLLLLLLDLLANESIFSHSLKRTFFSDTACSGISALITTFGGTTLGPLFSSLFSTLDSDGEKVLFLALLLRTSKTAEGAVGVRRG